MNQASQPIPDSGTKALIRVVLVDDEVNVLRGLSRGLNSLTEELEIHTCTSGDACLALLRDKVVDVVVTDLHMPGMNGAELLERIRDGHPTVLRLVLSGEAKPEIFLNASNHALKCMSKPCDAAILLEVIRDAIREISRIRSPDVAKIISRLSSLPSTRAIQMQITSVIADPNADLEKTSGAVRHDPAMVSRILKVANSAFFGHSGKIETLDDAISLLGIDSVICMMATHRLLALSAPAASSRLSVENLWEHSARTAGLARILGPRLKMSSTVTREAITAALLHDVGKLILACAIPEHFAAACTRAQADLIPQWQSEYPIFGNHHAEVGACLLRLWGLPESIVKGVENHHTPHHSKGVAASSALVVHIADVLDHYKDEGRAPVLLDRESLIAAGLPGDVERLKNLLPN